jgi:hypothetical protein
MDLKDKCAGKSRVRLWSESRSRDASQDSFQPSSCPAVNTAVQAAAAPDPKNNNSGANKGCKYRRDKS